MPEEDSHATICGIGVKVDLRVVAAVQGNSSTADKGDVSGYCRLNGNARKLPVHGSRFTYRVAAGDTDAASGATTFDCVLRDGAWSWLAWTPKYSS